MSQDSAIGTREVPCPVCGYDLRARVSPKCPECGAVYRQSISSRIPWVHRAYRGRFTAFRQTIWMTIMRTGDLVREAEWRINRVEASKFHRVALLVGSLIGTVLLMSAFSFRGRKWRSQLELEMPWGLDEGGTNISFPANILTDSYWGALPLFVSAYLCLAVSMWIYRGFLGLLSGKRRHRIQVRRMGLYMSSQAVVQSIILGLLATAGMILYDNHAWKKYLETPLGVMVWILIGLCGMSFYLPTVRLIWRTGRWRLFRIFCMVILFPNAAILAGSASGFVVFWVAGYVVMGIRSMLA